jgi:hypothetical protein
VGVSAPSFFDVPSKTITDNRRKTGETDAETCHAFTVKERTWGTLPTSRAVPNELKDHGIVPRNNISCLVDLV